MNEQRPSWPPYRASKKLDVHDPTFAAADLLWSDTDFFQVPHIHSADVLAAIRSALDRHRPLEGGEQEFLDISARFVAAGPQGFAAVWSSPQAYYWTRVAFQLLGSCLAGMTVAPSAGLAPHLDQFKAFALASAWHAGADWTFVRPLRVALPFAIPATRWSLDGTGTIDILGLEEGRLIVTTSGATHAVPLAGEPFVSAGLTVRECPVVRHAGCELQVHPHAFHAPGLDFAEPALRAGWDYHERHLTLVQQTLENVQRYAPDIFARFGQAIHLIALKPRDWGNYDDYSDPQFPGSFIASVVHHSLEMADHFIHEFQHNRLSLMEEYGPLFDTAHGDPERDTRYYSPWRDKPRGLYGIYHGVYVFVAVCRYWLAVYQNDEVGPADRAYVVDRLLRLPRQLVLAVGVLRRHAHLTPLGQALLDQFTRDVEHLGEQVGKVGLPAEGPALRVGEDGSYLPELSKVDGRPLAVGESVREHLRLHDRNHQCAGLLDDS